MIDDFIRRSFWLAANLPRAGRLAAPAASVEKVAALRQPGGVDVVVDGDRWPTSPGREGLRARQAAASVLGAQVIARASPSSNWPDAVSAM